MIVGIDVAHPSPGSMENAPSVVGMVASCDEFYAHWPGGVKIQASRQEIQKLRRERLEKKLEGSADGTEDMADPPNMQSLIRDRIRLYFDRHSGNLPENILIYRDGKPSIAPGSCSELT